MNSVHKNRLQQNEEFLKNNLKFNGQFLQEIENLELFGAQSGVLQDIKSCPDEAERIKKFLFNLKNVKENGTKIYEIFLKALILSEQEDIAKKIDTKKTERLKNDMHSKPGCLLKEVLPSTCIDQNTQVLPHSVNNASSVLPSRTQNDKVLPPSGDVTRDTPSNEQTECIYARKDPTSNRGHEYLPHIPTPMDESPKAGLFQNPDDCTVHCVEFTRARDLLADTENVYKMNSIPRGRVVIVNNYQFKYLPARDGTHQDACTLSEFFENIGFKVIMENNLSATDIKDLLKEERTNDEHKDCDAFVLVLLSHGNKGIVYGTDGMRSKWDGRTVFNNYVSVHDDVVASFDGMHCPQLVGKPKLFFIQACQGDDKTLGVVQPDDDEVDDDISDARPVVPPDPSLDEVKLTTHERADMLLALSTVEGYKSFRHTVNGSWFIQDLISVFASKCHQEDMLSMMTEVIKKVNQRQMMFGKYVQIGEFRSTLTKKLYFLPGYPQQTNVNLFQSSKTPEQQRVFKAPTVSSQGPSPPITARSSEQNVQRIDDPSLRTSLKEKLRGSYDIFCENLSPDEVIPFLYAKSVLSLLEKEKLDAINVRYIKAQTLIDTMMRKDADKILIFKEGLNKHGMSHLASYIVNTGNT